MDKKLTRKIEDLREYWGFLLNDNEYLDNKNGCIIHQDKIKNIQFDGNIAIISIKGLPLSCIKIFRNKTLEIYINK